GVQFAVTALLHALAAVLRALATVVRALAAVVHAPAAVVHASTAPTDRFAARPVEPPDGLPPHVRTGASPRSRRGPHDPDPRRPSRRPRHVAHERHRLLVHARRRPLPPRTRSWARAGRLARGRPGAEARRPRATGRAVPVHG